MQGILLSNLKLSNTDSLPGYLLCAASEKLPGYNYFVTDESVIALNDACGNSAVAKLFDSDIEMWLVSLINCSTVLDFENELFKGFEDTRDIIARMAVTIAEPVANDTLWIEIESSDIKPDYASSVKLQNLSPSEVITLAEYDSVINYLKTSSFNQRAKISLYDSVIRTMLSLEQLNISGMNSVLDVMFQNVILSFQIAKNTAPDAARKFLTHVMKEYVLKVKRSEE